jgi:lysine/ornithine N-monooxygenase
MVVRLEKIAIGFRATFDDDEVLRARHVILAVGVGPFKHIPDILSGLPAALLSHSAAYGPIDQLVNKQVIVLGSGALASDLAALLHEQGTAVSGLLTGVGFLALSWMSALKLGSFFELEQRPVYYRMHHSPFFPRCSTALSSACSAAQSLCTAT